MSVRQRKQKLENVDNDVKGFNDLKGVNGFNDANGFDDVNGFNDESSQTLTVTKTAKKKDAGKM
jgi:hypothetical protein